jgi:hypothetical protein
MNSKAKQCNANLLKQCFVSFVLTLSEQMDWVNRVKTWEKGAQVLLLVGK